MSVGLFISTSLAVSTPSIPMFIVTCVFVITSIETSPFASMTMFCISSRGVGLPFVLSNAGLSVKVTVCVRASISSVTAFKVICVVTSTLLLTFAILSPPTVI